jgi:C-terminal processing protease CtpA/Prc
VCLAVLFPRNTELNNTFQGWYWGYLDGKWGLVPCTHLEDEMGDSGLPAWEAAVPFTVTLDLDFASISSPEEYKTEFIKDIAFASNTAEVFFKFAGLRAGSIINEMLVAHGGGNPDSIIQGLIKQLDDPNSCLMQGKWTRKSIAIDPATKLGGSVLSEPSVVVGQVKSAHDNHEALEVSRIQNAKGPEKNHGVEKYMVPQDSSDYSPQSVRAAKVSHSPTEKEQETAARTPEQASQPENRIGIGVALAKAEKGVFIAEIRPGSAAFQAGLQVGELLESIDEQPLEGLELSNVVSMLRGPPGSSIKVEVSRKLTGSTAMLPLTIAMTRGAIADQGEDVNKTPLESHGRGTSNQTEATDQAGVSSVRPLTDDFGDDEENCYEKEQEAERAWAKKKEHLSLLMDEYALGLKRLQAGETEKTEKSSQDASSASLNRAPAPVRLGPAPEPEHNAAIGIGVALAKAEKGFFIAEIRPGSAAFQAGLQVGELLESIDEQPLEGLELSNVVSMLRGPPGSSIKVEVSRKLTGSTAMLPLTIAMTRGAIADQGEDVNKTPLESHGRGTSNQTEATNQAGVSSVRPLTDDFGDDEENCYESMPGSRGLARARALHLLRLNRTRQAKKMSSQSVPARAEWQQDGNDPFRESALSWTSDITPRTLVTSASEPAGTTSAPDMAEIIDTYDASERVIYDSVTSAPDIYDSVSVMYDDVPFAHGMDNVLVHPPTHQEVLSPGMRPACATRAACTFNAAAHAVAF